MLKTLMIDYFFPSNTYAYELVKELQKLADVDMMCRKDAPDSPDLNRQIKTLYGGGANKLAALFKYSKSLGDIKSTVCDPSYDVVHLQFMKKPKYEIPLLTNKRRKAALVHTVHNVLPHENSNKEEQLYAEFYHHCDALIVHNNFCKKVLVEDYGINDSRIAVVPHGIYGDIKELPIRKKDGKTHFLLFGGIRDYKGVDVLLKAVALLPENIKQQCIFTIAGKPFTDLCHVNYKTMAKELGVEDSINFILKRIPDEDVPVLFGDADICLFPYKHIYGSGALLMAYTYLKPVLASDVPAFIEETDNGSTGMLFESEKAESLAKAIEEFVNMSSEKKKQYSENIRALVNQKYNWASSAKKTLELYKSVAE